MRRSHLLTHGNASEDALKPADLDLSEYLPYLVNRVGAALVERFTESALNEARLTIGMWRLLVIMSNHTGARQVDLASLTSIEVSTVSRLVTRLVLRGLVSRSRSARSSREVLVELTPKGRSLVAGLVPTAVDLEKTAIRGISRKELAATKRVLRSMHRNLADLGVSRRRAGDASRARL
jgi:MarR family transcriptional regulator, organic hydroperoxide resistance regulator